MRKLSAVFNKHNNSTFIISALLIVPFIYLFYLAQDNILCVNEKVCITYGAGIGSFLISVIQMVSLYIFILYIGSYKDKLKIKRRKKALIIFIIFSVLQLFNFFSYTKVTENKISISDLNIFGTSGENFSSITDVVIDDLTTFNLTRESYELNNINEIIRVYYPSSGSRPSTRGCGRHFYLVTNQNKKIFIYLNKEQIEYLNSRDIKLKNYNSKQVCKDFWGSLYFY